MPKAAWCWRTRCSLAARRKPRAIIDYATLTGACVYALTERYSGAFTNRPEARDLIEAAGSSSGERVWCFPMDTDYDTDLESTRRRRHAVCGRRQGRSHPGGAFLEPLRAQGHPLAAPRSRRRHRATAASRTSPPKSPDSACATRSICCAVAGRRGGSRLRAAMNTLDAFSGPTTGTCTCATARRSRPS